MKKLISFVGVGCLLLGFFETTRTISFVSTALTLPAKVVSIETRTGPPKPTQNTPVHVTFTLPAGGERSAITHMPLLQKVKEGDVIYVLVSPENPQDVRLPLLSELWARPFAFLVAGLVLLCGVLFVRVRQGEVWEAGSSNSAAQ